MTEKICSLRLADELAGDQLYGLQRRCRDEAAAELRRLHAENESLQQKLRSTEATLQRGREVWIASAEAWSRDVAERDALLRQALEALETDDWQKKLMAANVIRQHMEGKA